MKQRDDAPELIGLVNEIVGLQGADARRLDAALRARYGGEAVRIAERPPVTLGEIDAGLRERKPVRVIAEEVGLSRATIYRMLGNRKNLSKQTA